MHQTALSRKEEITLMTSLSMTLAYIQLMQINFMGNIFYGANTSLNINYMI